jgi:hypothetical protein
MRRWVMGTAQWMLYYVIYNGFFDETPLVLAPQCAPQRLNHV